MPSDVGRRLIPLKARSRREDAKPSRFDFPSKTMPQERRFSSARPIRMTVSVISESVPIKLGLRLMLNSIESYSYKALLGPEIGLQNAPQWLSFQGVLPAKLDGSYARKTL